MLTYKHNAINQVTLLTFMYVLFRNTFSTFLFQGATGPAGKRGWDGQKGIDVRLNSLAIAHFHHSLKEDKYNNNAISILCMYIYYMPFAILIPICTENGFCFLHYDWLDIIPLY